MIAQVIIDRAKQVPILEYLKQEGFTPYKTWGHNARFHSPLRVDQCPSFDIDTAKNVWLDRGLNIGGDTIEFVKRYRNCGFKEAVVELLDFSSSFSFRQPFTTLSRKAFGIRDLKVTPLTNQALLQYLDSRAIDHSMARRYLQEAHYTSGKQNKSYYSLAWANSLGGYELRNKYFKGCTGSKSYTFIRAANRSGVLLFEGMMDFLSLLTLNGQSEPPLPALILNSTTLLNGDLVPKLNGFKVHAHFDNDTTGNQAVKLLRSGTIDVVDHRCEYATHKDLNEFLMDRKRFKKKS